MVRGNFYVLLVVSLKGLELKFLTRSYSITLLVTLVILIRNKERRTALLPWP